MGLFLSNYMKVLFQAFKQLRDSLWSKTDSLYYLLSHFFKCSYATINFRKEQISI